MCGARSEVVEGVIVGEGSVLSMGVFIGQSTKIIHRNTGEVIYGKIPPYSVVALSSFHRSIYMCDWQSRSVLSYLVLTIQHVL